MGDRADRRGGAATKDGGRRFAFPLRLLYSDSTARQRQPVYADGGGVGAAFEDEVVGGDQVGEHVQRMAGQREFGNGFGDLAVADHEAGGAAGIVAGDAVDAAAHHFRDQHALDDVGH